MVAKVLRVFARVWFVAVAAVVILGSVAYILRAEEKLAALGAVWGQLNPFNLAFYLAMVVLALPGILASLAADRLDRGRADA